ncbi:hypothetical protein TRFO_34829 [Tritrichomonas foetus]|uniref:Uncharacterized protein n=1 Tax=Tritrichomonas foetus TaxID=1144522 RepID=A0A1J4JM95_9EUKA|nr:hypothetical protein TRFO_34829 [Tritrichomonas foetus]|eukprot:OHS98683.1 hypothetical protein TRFO_34829 [Tritrichomonas foetus]
MIILHLKIIIINFIIIVLVYIHIFIKCIVISLVSFYYAHSFFEPESFQNLKGRSHLRWFLLQTRIFFHDIIEKQIWRRYQVHFVFGLFVIVIIVVVIIHISLFASRSCWHVNKFAVEKMSFNFIELPVFEFLLRKDVMAPVLGRRSDTARHRNFICVDCRFW